jgi:predicted branched-subunit amino acid permease
MVSEEPGGAIRFTRAGMLRGMHGSNTIMLAFAPFGVVAGIAAQEHGLSLLEAALMSAFVFAGSAQLLVLSTWTVPASVIAATFAALVINLRFALMGPVLAPWLDRVRGWRLWLSLFLMADQNWALSVNDLRNGGCDAGYLFGSGVTLWFAWLISSIAGYAVGAALKPAPGHPLFFAALATFIGMLVLLYRGRGDIFPWVVAAAVALAVARLLPGTPWYIVAGAITGSALAAWRDIRNGTAPA